MYTTRNCFTVDLHKNEINLMTGKATRQLWLRFSSMEVIWKAKKRSYWNYASLKCVLDTGTWTAPFLSVVANLNLANLAHSRFKRMKMVVGMSENFFCLLQKSSWGRLTLNSPLDQLFMVPQSEIQFNSPLGNRKHFVWLNYKHPILAFT